MMWETDAPIPTANGDEELSSGDRLESVCLQGACIVPARTGAPSQICAEAQAWDHR